MVLYELQKRIMHNHKHHPPKDSGVAKLHQSVRNVTENAALIISEACPEGRELSIALTKLEEAMFWANAGIARRHGKE